jgi:hypothetical protein
MIAAFRKPGQSGLTSPWPSRSRRDKYSNRATSATTAANDISKLGSNTDWGVTTRTAKAAIATFRMVSAGRSSITAMSTMLIM